MGWVVERHGALYAQEYGFDAAFEALVASIVAKFLAHLDPERERCWIAERNDGERVGCVFLVRASQRIGKLRLFLVEPDARPGGSAVASSARLASTTSFSGERASARSRLVCASA